MVNKRIDVHLTDEEYEFLRWLAERDRVSIQTEMCMIFTLEFENCKTLYEEEMRIELDRSGETGKI